MKYKILCEEQEENLVDRLLKSRNIFDNKEDFLNPKIKNYWINPFLLNDMQKAVERIIQGLKKNDKIMIFWDYDVDGITSSFILYDFIKNQLHYNKVSIMYPNRVKDGYGIKNKHVDEMKSKNIDLIITVDNGITSVAEAEYCKENNIDLIITDHHKALENIPQAIAVVNPQVSPDYPFKGIAWVGVAFKLINALMQSSNLSEEKKTELFNYYLPIVAIGTVADIVPLVQENRAIVKRGLDIMNNHKSMLPTTLIGILDFLKLTNIDTFHIGFMIGPRINAWWRIDSPYKSLHTLLHQGEKQKKSLEELEEINTERRKMQENMYKMAEKIIDLEEKILIAEHEEFHEWIVGIVSGRITEKYNKPSAIFKINKEEGIAVASLRAPNYFNIVKMLQAHTDLLERFWGHKQAWGLSVKLENLETLKQELYTYCKKITEDISLEKIIEVDTELKEKDLIPTSLQEVEQLAPFGEGNQEPTFLIKNITINKVDKIWQKGKGHLKINGKIWTNSIDVMFRWKGDDTEKIKERKENTLNIIWKIKKDTYKWWYFIHGIHYF